MVEKRDGRRQWLRLTKTAQSIERALASAPGEQPASAVAERVPAGSLVMHRGGPLVASELAAQALKLARKTVATSGTALPTAIIAEAVQTVLVADGRPVAASRFAEVGFEQQRRQRAFFGCAPGTDNPPSSRFTHDS